MRSIWLGLGLGLRLRPRPCIGMRGLVVSFFSTMYCFYYCSRYCSLISYHSFIIYFPPPNYSSKLNLISYLILRECGGGFDVTVGSTRRYYGSGVRCTFDVVWCF